MPRLYAKTLLSRKRWDKSKPGNNRPKRRGPLFWYLTLQHSRCRQASHLHLRTGEVALISTTVLELAPTKTASRRSVRTAFSVFQNWRREPSTRVSEFVAAASLGTVKASPSHSLPANTQACRAGNIEYRGTNDQSSIPLFYPV